MRKIDFAKINLVRQLVREANFHKQRNEMDEAGKIAEELKELGYPVTAGHIYKSIGNIEKARELIVPEAEKLCEEGYHASEAVYYKTVGLVEKFLLAHEEHKVWYETRVTKTRPIN